MKHFLILLICGSPFVLSAQFDTVAFKKQKEYCIINAFDSNQILARQFSSTLLGINYSETAENSSLYFEIKNDSIIWAKNREEVRAKPMYILSKQISGDIFILDMGRKNIQEKIVYDTIGIFSPATGEIKNAKKELFGKWSIPGKIENSNGSIILQTGKVKPIWSAFIFLYYHRYLQSSK